MIRIGINGFGRIGRLVFRILGEKSDLQVVHINDPAGDASCHAHLVNFDSVYGRWHQQLEAADSELLHLNQQPIRLSSESRLEAVSWDACDLVVEASGKFRNLKSLQQYELNGVNKVVVTAPVYEHGVANIVMGVNNLDFDLSRHRIVTAASCTTNCLAPVVGVIDRTFGIRHGSMTTIHALTNTQTILDAAHKDLRRARACGSSLIPTTTGSAKAITNIFPHLDGRLNGHAVRVPLPSPSLTDCVFELSKPTTSEQVNAALEAAAQTEILKPILGVENRPLVSIDFKGDPRSAIIDALSTMVVNKTQLKLYAWYDNEWGYANRTAELVEQYAGI